MPLYEIHPDHLRALDSTTFTAVNVTERGDLQRLLRDQIETIADDVLVIAEEFGDFEDSNRRIDLLAIDKAANLVVIELKRTEGGGHMELQAVRYAAMVSAMTFSQVVDAYDSYLSQRGREEDARESLLTFLEWSEPEEDRFAQETRIVLASADFGRELTSAVLWLNDHGLDIRCVRLRPYRDSNRTLIDVQQLIPLPEAEEYQIRTKVKSQRERADKDSNSLRHQRRLQFWTELIQRCKGRTDLHANLKPSPYNWLGTGSGVRGLGLNYSVRQHDSTVQLYIDRGPAARHENQAIFDYLAANQEAIESAFGHKLEWQELTEKRACRILNWVKMGGWRDDPDSWPEVFDEMIARMIRLESALRPHLDQIHRDVLEPLENGNNQSG